MKNSLSGMLKSSITSIVFISLLVCWQIPSRAINRNSQGENQKFLIKFQDGTLSVKLEKADIKKVLKEISCQTGVKIKIFSGVTGKITADFTNLPLMEGMKKLISMKSYAAEFFTTSEGKNQKKKYVLKKITIVPESKKKFVKNISFTLQEKKVKEKVLQHIKRIRGICQKVEDLEVIGFVTMKDGKAIVDLGNNAIPTLLEILGDRNEDWKVRFFVMELLGNIPDERNKEPLIVMFQDNSERNVLRISAAKNIGVLKFKEAVPALIKGAKEENNRNLKCTILSSLGMVRDQRAIPILEENLNQDDYLIATVSARSLGMIGSSESIQSLSETFNEKEGSKEREKSEKIPKGLQEKIIKINAASALGNIDSPESTKVLTKVLKNEKENMDVRITAAESLGKLKDANSVKDLVEMANKTQNPRLKVHCLKSLGKIDKNKALSIISEVQSKNIKNQYLNEQIIKLKKSLGEKK